MRSASPPSASHAPSAVRPLPTATAIAAALTKDRRLMRPSQLPVTPERPASYWIDVSFRERYTNEPRGRCSVVENSSLKLSPPFLLLASHYDKRVLDIRGCFDENLLAAVGAADSVVGNGRAIEGDGSYLL